MYKVDCIFLANISIHMLRFRQLGFHFFEIKFGIDFHIRLVLELHILVMVSKQYFLH